MPVFNGEKYLHSAIKSILDQTFPDFEFLIMDDGSTDRTSQILESYAKKDARIKFFHQTNSGIVKSLNTLIAHARANIIARMDADDFAHPKRFEMQHNYLHNHPKTVLLGTYAKIIEKRNSGEWRPNTAFEEDILNRWYLSIFPPFIHSGVMFTKKAFIQAGCYRQDEYPAEDYGLWINMKNYGEINTVPEILTDYFLNTEGISAKNYRKQIKKRDKLNLKNLEDLYQNNEIPAVKTALELLEKYNLDKHQRRVLAKLACLTGCFLASQHHQVDAGEYFKLCLKMDPRRFDAALNLLFKKSRKTFMISIDKYPHRFKFLLKIHTFPRQKNS